MEKKTRNILIASGIVLAGAVGAYFIFKKPKGTGSGDSNSNSNTGTGIDSGSTGGTNTGNTQVSGNCEADSAVGKIAQVKDSSANTREGACTDTDLVVTAKDSGTNIGTVQKVQLGCADASGNFYWYYVRLTEELEDASGYDYGFYTTEHTHAWVRCDVVRLV
tara:strand:- start:835 stop:1323 length:489 start_codon:yes stop_codon:yes gene_type:complete